MAWKRYKDPESGDEFTADETAGKAMGLEPLEKVAEDASGRPLPPKAHIDLAGETTGNEPNKSWRHADLVAYATENGVQFDEGATKAEILAAITSQEV